MVFNSPSGAFANSRGRFLVAPGHKDYIKKSPEGAAVIQECHEIKI